MLTCFEQHNVVHYDFPHGDFQFDSTAHDFRRRRDQNGKFIDLFFCKNFLYDADDKVCAEDGDEQKLRNARLRIEKSACNDHAQ